MKDLIEVFEANSKMAMKQSEDAIVQRNWVKAERKETESETWHEAARLLKRECEKSKAENYIETRYPNKDNIIPPKSVTNPHI